MWQNLYRGLIHKEGEREREREIDEDMQDVFVFREFFTLVFETWPAVLPAHIVWECIKLQDLI